MKNLVYLVLLLPFIACKQTTTTDTNSTQITVETVEVNKKKYPEDFGKALDAHGGLANWKQQRTLSFVLPKPDNTETHTIDLWSRNEKVETPDYTFGYDGKPWVLDSNGNYKGNPEFYHNLMFYFYAMPFVLADEGIIYSETEDLVFDGVSYPGIKISYDAGVGITPKDEYYIHYNAETHKMAWLGYTVTYRSGEKSDNVKWIRYDDWKTINDLVLPNSISWYIVEDGKIKEVRNIVVFENVTLSTVAKPTAFYDKPEKGEYWVKSRKE
ncbi:hypothetical protein MTsPCn9_01770 [Croceitalea sp. MTPC9]|uniref:DUF6503 family protein n=1 Tax=unclassified Croceitalea TaxID=2632280 RepID=UPI002B3F1498|nr:hypothetical protein MTsPCn6_06940 [Croceitalea sp. MTPC6]GMN15241.1 hypothetical protein MTsPCn9_01770 [Croceitalea sp. MTPC9]